MSRSSSAIECRFQSARISSYSSAAKSRRSSSTTASWCIGASFVAVEIAGVRDAKLRRDVTLEEREELGRGALVAHAPGELGCVVGGGRGLQLALQDPERVQRHQGAELEPMVVHQGKHLALEELAHRL